MASASSNIDDEDPSQPSFGAIFTDTQKSLEWFRAQGLIPQLTKCPTCSKDMKEFNKREREDGKAFHCSKCNKQLSLRHGSIFYKSTLPLPVLAYLIFYFATDVPAFIASRLLGPSVCYKTIIQWYYKFRNICSKRFEVSPLKFYGNEVALLCGEDTVEIDESLFGKKAKKVGDKPRGTSRQKYSVFGIVEKRGRRCVLYYVPDRKRTTLFEIIQRHIDTSCKINHDGAAVYATLGDIGYEHDVVCHNVEFVTAEGIHTNTIEGLWGLLKQRISRMHGLPSFTSLVALLDEFSYRQNYGSSNGSIWKQFLQDVRELGLAVSAEEAPLDNQ